MQAARLSRFIEIGEVYGASGLEDSADLPQRKQLRVAVDVVEHQGGQHGIEAGVRKREPLRVGQVEAHLESSSLCFTAGTSQSFGVRVDSDDLSGRVEALGQDGEAPGAAADIEHSRARANAGLFEQASVVSLDAQ